MKGHQQRRRRGFSRAAALILACLLITIANTGSGGATSAAAGDGGTLPGISHSVLTTQRSTARVGALFRSGLSGGHHCTAGVVRSSGRDLLVTAAHCLSGSTANARFVPGYLNGAAPYGTWTIKKVIVSPKWTSDSDENLDVAFAIVQPLGGRHVQDVVGGYKLGIGKSSTSTVRLTGYPSSAEAPLTCTNRIAPYTAHQLRIACTAFTGGTSGSPWVTGLDAGTGAGTVIGVIGGYQQGGDTPDVSYSPSFGREVAALYQQAVNAGG
jgi:V8-like Glu-specific endopeptidase